jgi:hypothetical protein
MWSKPKVGGIYKLDIIPNNCIVHARVDKATGEVLRWVPIYQTTGTMRSPIGFIKPGDAFMVLSSDVVERSGFGVDLNTDNILVLFEEISGIVMLNIFRGCKRIT